MIPACAEPDAALAVQRRAPEQLARPMATPFQQWPLTSRCGGDAVRRRSIGVGAGAGVGSAQALAAEPRAQKRPGAVRAGVCIGAGPPRHRRRALATVQAAAQHVRDLCRRRWRSDRWRDNRRRRNDRCWRSRCRRAWRRRGTRCRYFSGWRDVNNRGRRIRSLGTRAESSFGRAREGGWLDRRRRRRRRRFALLLPAHRRRNGGRRGQLSPCRSRKIMLSGRVVAATWPRI